MDENEQRANEILEIKLNAAKDLTISKEMLQAINKIAEVKGTNGRIITTGMGKAGIIAYKMSATMSSIGLPSFYVDPAAAAHGDIGRIMSDDLIIVFSNSGNTNEVVKMITALNLLNSGKNYVITIGGNDNPRIPSNLVISYGKLTESCVVSKVPSTSTTIMLMIADILSITASESLGLDDSWFKARHPGGVIGAAYKSK